MAPDALDLARATNRSQPACDALRFAFIGARGEHNASAVDLLCHNRS
jgi:hypothetical protein